MAPDFLNSSIPHTLGISMNIIRNDISGFIAKETLRSFMRPYTSIGLELKPHTFLYGRVMLRPNCFMTFSGMMFVEASESNIQLCNKSSLMAKVSMNDSCPGFRSGRWMFCKSSGNSSSSKPRDFLIFHCCHGSFAISFNGTSTVIFPIVVSRSMSSPMSLRFSLFLMVSFF